MPGTIENLFKGITINKRETMVFDNNVVIRSSRNPFSNKPIAVIKCSHCMAKYKQKLLYDASSDFSAEMLLACRGTGCSERVYLKYESTDDI
jgi:hypothetical protein